VHFVDGGVDSGPIIGQRSVPVLEGDSRDVLANRILAQEHELLVESLEALARGELGLETGESGRRRVIRKPSGDAPG